MLIVAVCFCVLLGIKTTNRMQQLHDFNTVCYEKVVQQVRNGHQVGCLTNSVSSPCGPQGNPLLIPSLPQLLLYLLVSYTFPFFLSYLLYLFSCFSIPFHFTRVVSLCFQDGCRRSQLNLALVFLCVLTSYYMYFIV